MDMKALTPEEKNAITALVRSPGWAILFEKLIIPQVQQATQFLDRPAAEQSGRADWLRGVKASYMSLVDVLYAIAGMQNPFIRHAVGLLASVRLQPVESSVSVGEMSVEEIADQLWQERLRQMELASSIELKKEQQTMDEAWHGRRSGFPV